MRGGASHVSFHLLAQTGILEHLLPELTKAFTEAPRIVAANLERSLRTIDEVSAASKTEIPSALLLLALMIGNLSKERLAELEEDSKLNKYLPLLAGRGR